MPLQGASILGEIRSDPFRKVERDQTSYMAGLKKVEGLRELDSDYRGCNSYYYDATKNQILALSNVSGEIRNASYEEENHLRERNGLCKMFDSTKIYKVLPWDENTSRAGLTDYNKNTEYDKTYNTIVMKK
jgi:hypothetical protein